MRLAVLVIAKQLVVAAAAADTAEMTAATVVFLTVFALVGNMKSKSIAARGLDFADSKALATAMELAVVGSEACWVHKMCVGTALLAL